MQVALECGGALVYHSVCWGRVGAAQRLCDVRGLEGLYRVALIKDAQIAVRPLLHVEDHARMALGGERARLGVERARVAVVNGPEHRPAGGVVLGGLGHVAARPIEPGAVEDEAGRRRKGLDIVGRVLSEHAGFVAVALAYLLLTPRGIPVRARSPGQEDGTVAALAGLRGLPELMIGTAQAIGAADDDQLAAGVDRRLHGGQKLTPPEHKGPFVEYDA